MTFFSTFQVHTVHKKVYLFFYNITISKYDIYILVAVFNGIQTRQVHELKTNERAGVATLREVLEDRLREIKRAKTWKHERILTSPQDTKVGTKPEC